VTYLVPATLDEALVLLGAEAPAVVAGGTDVLPAWRQGGRPGQVLDLAGLAELRGIVPGPRGWRIGAATRWAEIARAPLPPAFDALREAAREVGAVQIQNAGTIGGNICNASPAADGVPPLLALDAEVELAATGGRRRFLPLGDFITGVRRTARRPEELVVALHLPEPPAAMGGGFVKLGARASLVISIAMVAAVVRLRGGHIIEARLAVGACSPVAQRLPVWEATLAGSEVGAALAVHPGPDALAGLAPIDDARATATYRLAAVGALCGRALARAVASAQGGVDAR
jgi:CO/xanthine dehydrogenase FAD-binding subunit